MAKFKNTKTGNVLIVNNDKTIALMNRSEQYERVYDEQPVAKAPAKKAPGRLKK